MDAAALIAALSAKPEAFWKCPKAFHSIETFEVDGWIVAVSFDGDDNNWDFIDHVVTPDGQTFGYEQLPDAVRFWCPWPR